MKTEREENRRTSTIIQDRDAQLAAEANEWARHESRRWFDDHKTGFYTPADILQGLDERADAPPAWLRWMSDYSTRYQMVRNACVALARKEFVDTRQEKNALGRDATSYQRARDLDSWQVVVAGGEEASVTDLVTWWLRENKRSLRGVRTIAITHGSSSESNQAGSSGTRSQSVQRRRSR